MKLFHTSANATIEAHNHGTFGEFLFFSSDVYTTVAGEYHVFSVGVDESKIIDAASIWYNNESSNCAPFVEEIMDTYGVDEDTAEQLIDESVSIYDIESNIEPEDMADASWDIQRLTAKCAKAMGYVGVCVTDEQGSAYMLDVTAINLTAEC